jgi:hypothetical protein
MAHGGTWQSPKRLSVKLGPSKVSPTNVPDRSRKFSSRDPSRGLFPDSNETDRTLLPAFRSLSPQDQLPHAKF